MIWVFASLAVLQTLLVARSYQQWRSAWAEFRALPPDSSWWKCDAIAEQARKWLMWLAASVLFLAGSLIILREAWLSTEPPEPFGVVDLAVLLYLVAFGVVYVQHEYGVRATKNRLERLRREGSG